MQAEQEPGGGRIAEERVRTGDAVAPPLPARSLRRSPRLPRASTASAADMARWVAACEAAVLAALPRRLSEAHLAQSLSIRPDALREAFEAVRGVRPYNALMRLRLQAARAMLQGDPTLDLVEVGRRCGFSHHGRFTRDFRRFSSAADPGGPADP